MLFKFDSFDSQAYKCSVVPLVENGHIVEVSHGDKYSLKKIGDELYLYGCNNKYVEVSAKYNLFPIDNPLILKYFYRKVGWILSKDEILLIFDGTVINTIKIINGKIDIDSHESFGIYDYEVITVNGYAYFMDVYKFIIDVMGYYGTDVKLVF